MGENGRRGKGRGGGRDDKKKKKEPGVTAGVAGFSPGLVGKTRGAVSFKTGDAQQTGEGPRQLFLVLFTTGSLWDRDLGIEFNSRVHLIFPIMGETLPGTLTSGHKANTPRRSEFCSAV